MSLNLTLQDVVDFLKENMQVSVTVEPVPYENCWTRISVTVRLDGEVIATGSDTYRT
jgi:hypothetical protein